MSGNKIGKMFNVTTFGSSHGKALGAVVDGCPAGLEISDKDIQIELDKRRPGTSNITTSRGEKDEVKFCLGYLMEKQMVHQLLLLCITETWIHQRMKILKIILDLDMGTTHGKHDTVHTITGEGDAEAEE